MKYSRQREMVLKAVTENKCHPTAEFIYNKLKVDLPSLSLATVYRNLNLLVNFGVIQRISMGDGIDRYDWETHPHNHLICTECESVINIPCKVNVEFDDEDIANRGYDVYRWTTMFTGLCPDCKAEIESEMNAAAREDDGELDEKDKI